jgi:hypothetical protein
MERRRRVDSAQANNVIGNDVVGNNLHVLSLMERVLDGFTSLVSLSFFNPCNTSNDTNDLGVGVGSM